MIFPHINIYLTVRYKIIFMEKMELLEYGNYYHIYNRGINSCDLFIEKTNFKYFLKLYEYHISPVADTFAWVLMKNHFHFLVRIKKENELRLQLSLKVESDGVLQNPHQRFSNLFNAYSKAYNKRYDRHGSLFERRFKRKHITDTEYLKQVILYIHNNPVHHGIVDTPLKYQWSSYKSFVSVQLKDQFIIEMNGSKIDDFDFQNEGLSNAAVDLIEEGLDL